MIAAFCAAAALALSLPFFALFQLSGYRFARGRKAGMCLRGPLVLCAIFALAGAGFALLAIGGAYYVLPPLCAVCACAVCAAVVKRRFAKTPPRVTARFVRLCAAGLFVGAALGCAAEFCVRATDLRYSGFAAAAVCALSPLCARFALLIALPVEKAIAARYRRICRRTLAERKGLFTIAVTGSFGKTSVKNYLAAMLSARYRVFASPASFNTPAGMCLSVAAMPKDAQIFVAEAGARRRGDIADICRLVSPSYGLVTGVGEQHLETFGSLSDVYAAKRELPQYLAAHGGACCFNVCNALAAKMYSECGCRALASGHFGDCTIDSVNMSSDGSEFELVFSNKERAVCRTALLGLANVQNVALAACVAHDLGVSAEEIAAAAAKLRPVPHRMQPVSAGKLLVIDDSYNADPEGVRNAFDTLRLFGGKRAVATQGIVEGGKEGARLNEELGRALADVADVAIVIGPNSADIERGLARAGYLGKLFFARDLEDAKALFTTVLDGVSVLLIQNDLPDNY